MRNAGVPGFYLHHRHRQSCLLVDKQTARVLLLDERLFSSSSATSAKEGSLLTRKEGGRNCEHETWKKLLCQLDDPVIDLSIATYVSLLQFCGQTQSLSEGCFVHRHLRNRGFHENPLLGSYLVQMYNDCGAFELADDLFNGLLHRDEVAFSSMARVLCRRGHPKAAIQLFEQMQQEGMLPNRLVFNSTLGACSSEGNLSQGKRMHARARQPPFSSDLAIDTSLINMYAKCLCPHPAKLIFKEMYVRDEIAWNAIISACSFDREGVDAFQFFHQMRQEGVMLNKVAGIHILDACGNHTASLEGKRVHTCIVGSTFEWEIMLATALINMYGKCGCVDYLEKIFYNVGVRDDVMWTALIGAFAQNGMLAESMKGFIQMQLEGMLPDTFVFTNSLSACANQLSLSDGNQLCARLLFQGNDINTVVGSTIVNLYGKLGSCENARRAFNMMHERDLFSCNTLISVYAGCEQAVNAHEVFSQMQYEGSVPDKITFISILTVCADQEALSRGKMIHVSIISLGFEEDMNVGNALANMYGKCGSLDRMCSLFHAMPEHSLVSWNIVISAYTQQGKPKEALELFQDLQRASIPPDRTTVICALSASALQGSLTEGLLLHDRFICCGFKSDLYSETTLVNVYGKCGSLEEARKMFDDVVEHDIGTWNAMISAYAENGEGELALQFFHLMLELRIRPTDITYVSVLFACSHVGLVDEACCHFESMKKDYAIFPRIEHYNCMIDLLSRAGRLDEAESVLKTMSMSMKPMSASLMPLLGACRNQADIVRAKRVAERVFQLEPDNVSPYVILSNIYSAMEMADDALEMMDLITDKNTDFNEVSDFQIDPEMFSIGYQDCV